MVALRVPQKWAQGPISVEFVRQDSGQGAHGLQNRKQEKFEKGLIRWERYPTIGPPKPFMEPAMSELANFDLNPEHDEQLYNLQSEVRIAREHLTEAETNLSAYLKQREKDIKKRMQEMAAAYGFNVRFDDGTGTATTTKTPRSAGLSEPSDVQIKLRNPETGETWKGRGQQPTWLKAYLASNKPVKALAVPGLRWDGKKTQEKTNPGWVDILVKGGYTEEELKAGV